LKNILLIVRWLLGIIICFFSIGGVASGAIGIASFILIIGLLFLPPVTNKLFIKKQKEHSSNEDESNSEREKNAIKYDPKIIHRESLQILESLHVLSTTKNHDTLVGRYEFISTMYGDIIKASKQKRFLSDIQVAIDDYKLRYYDRILDDHEIQLLVEPDYEKLTEYYSYCLFHSFNSFYSEQKEQIENLKRDDAKLRRKEKIIEVGNKTLTEFGINGSDNDRYRALLNSLKELIDRLKSSSKYF